MIAAKRNNGILFFFLSLIFYFFSCASQAGDKELTDSLAIYADNHEKFIGSSIVLGALDNPARPELSARYREVASSQFNLIVPESEMKMAAMWKAGDKIDFDMADRIADWAVENDMKMRGHVLVWHRSLPNWLVDGYFSGIYNSSDVSNLVEWYITRVIGHYGTKYPGLVIAWDVVNEAIGPNDCRQDANFGLRPPGADYETKGEDFWRLTLGDDYVKKAFLWARAADPEAKLFYNDYHNEYSNPKGEAIYKFVNGLIADNVPIDGIGLQCHFSVSYLDMSYPNITFSFENISATIDRWIACGLDVQITEADIGMNAGQEDRQMNFFSALLKASLFKSGVSAFVTWGFTDLVSWREDEKSLYFDTRINPKPAYYAMLDALSSW